MLNIKSLKTRMGASTLLAASACLFMPITAAQPSTPTLDEALESLSTYTELQAYLVRIASKSKRHVQVGPLIDSGTNLGIVNIDSPLDLTLPVDSQVCGETNSAPTVREAVVCTIEPGGRGNTDPAKIGKSHHGRELLAARIGNPDGARVMIITQQHGNEVAGTEAAREVLEKLSGSNSSFNRWVLDRLNLLFVLRANPDGGEPSPECADQVLPVAQPFFGDCALTRTNLDPSAGGGFVANTEPGFSGVVGHGYNLNRYHYVGLDDAIRPLENQAMVAAALVFQPDYVLDLHGDIQKTDCDLDFSSIVPNAFLGVLPTVDCLPSEYPEEEVRQISVYAGGLNDSEKSLETRALATRILDRTSKATLGSVGRFSQLQLGAGAVNLGASEAYQRIGSITSGWESTNFGLDLRPDVQAFVNGVPSIGPNTFMIDPGNLKTQIKLNKIALRAALAAIADFQLRPPTDDGGFCDYPLARGINANLPPALWGAGGTVEPVTIPIVPGIGVPIAILGACPGE